MRLLTLALLTVVCLAQKTYTLSGTVQAVNTAEKRVSVANDPIPGGMGSMTMTYSVDDESVLGRLHSGDRITAQWHEGEMKLYGLTVASPEKTGMRLEDLERMALANNPTAAQAEANARASASLARQSGFYPNPTVGYYSDEIRGGSYGGGKQGGYVSQTIVTGGKLQAARKTAGLAVAEARTSAEMQRLRIVNNVRVLFYQVLAAQRMVEVREKLAKLADDSTQTGHQLANIGQADRPDVLQAEVEQRRAEVQLRTARQSLAGMWRTLAAVTGKPELPLAHLEGDLESIPELTYEEALTTTLRDSPEIKLAEQGIEKAQSMLVQARKAPIPNIELNANLSQDLEQLDTIRKPVGIVGGVQLGVQLPIFNRNQGNVAAARDEIEIARQELVRRRLEITRDLAARFRDYDNARVTAQQYKSEMLPRAEQAYQMYSTNYRNMAAAYPQALMSQRTLFQLEVDYVETLAAAWQAALELRGFGLMNGLATPLH